MPFSDPPAVKKDDIFEVTLRGELCGQTTLTVLHYKFDNESEPVLPDVYDEVIDAVLIANGLRDKYCEAAADNYQFKEVVVQDIYPIRFARAARTDLKDGQMGSDASTADLAVVFEKSGYYATDRHLKQKKGRTGLVHFPAPPADKITDGIVNQGYLDLQIDELAQKVVNILTTAAGYELIPGLFHSRALAKTFTETNRYSIKQQARVMRRRTVGLGI